MIGLQGQTLLHQVLGVEVAANHPDEDDEHKEAKQRPADGIACLQEKFRQHMRRRQTMQKRCELPLGATGAKDGSIRRTVVYQKPP